MTPIVNGLEADYADRIVVQKLDANTPEGRQVMQSYRLRGHPAILLFDAAGEVVWQGLGQQSRKTVVAPIETMD